MRILGFLYFYIFIFFHFSLRFPQVVEDDAHLQRGEQLLALAVAGAQQGLGELGVVMDPVHQAGGLSRNDVAEKLGVSPQYVSKILSGKVNFSFKTISEIEEGLGIELFQAAAMEA